MAAERFYIHRSGDTAACALTAVKDEPRLLQADGAAPWRFWMQVTRFQVEDGRLGFVFDTAVAKIQADGFFLFTGSPKLLGQPVLVTPPQEEPSNA